VNDARKTESPRFRTNNKDEIDYGNPRARLEHPLDNQSCNQAIANVKNEKKNFKLIKGDEIVH